MELCEASLDKLFLNDGDSKKYCGPILPKEYIILQLATGLEYIHGQNLVHRDIKPANALIWVGPREEKTAGTKVLIKWSDFGLSKRITGQNGSFSISDFKGTLSWFAPEILKLYYQEEEPDASRKRGTVKSDVFAEGLTFAFILLGGKHPYGENPFEIPNNVIINNPVNLKSQLLRFYFY